MRRKQPAAAVGTSANLSVEGLSAGYSGSQVLFDVSLDAADGAITVLLGRNGVGKSTFVRAVCGLLPVLGGTVKLADDVVTGLPAHELALRGMSVLSQGKRVYPSLTVAENLGLGELTRQRRARRSIDVGSHWSEERILERFPIFRERMKTKAGSLSGGEQQSLSFARAMISGPWILILDEPSEALSPARVKELSGLLAQLRDQGMPVLLVEQNVELALALADLVYVMDKGEIVLRLDRSELAENRDRLESLLTI